MARCEILNGRSVAFHKPFTARIAQNRALTAGSFSEQDAQAGQTRRGKLEKLHVLQRQAPPPDDSDTVTGEGVGIGGRFVDLAEAAGGEDDRLRLENVQFARGKIVCNNTGGGGGGGVSGVVFVVLAEAAGGEDDRLRLENVQFARGKIVCNNTGGVGLFCFLGSGGGHDEVKHVVLVEEVNAELDAVLEQGLQDHVSSAVCRVTGATDRSLAVVTGVSTETSLVDFSLGRPVKGQAHVFQINDGINGLFGENFRSILIYEVIATFDGVESVPLPAVFFDIGQCRGHATLCSSGVGTRGIQF